ncbi:MAG: DUF1684 domain-containing protein [Polyangia bacterium]
MRRLCPVLLLAACHHTAAPPAGPPSDGVWRAELEKWKQERRESVVGPEGWLTLVSLGWIDQGDNLVGADATAKVRLPADRAPAKLGTLTLDGDHVHGHFGAGVTHAGVTFTDGALRDDRDGQEPTVLEHGSLSMHVIKRGSRFALRVKDREHPGRKTFAGLTYYDADPKLHVRAHLVAAPAGKTLPIVNVLGQTEAMPSPGTLHFELADKPYTLDAVVEPGEAQLFILFRDQTAGQGTYPSGRFLYTTAPDEAGNVDLDFNRAYNPPCAFTEYATCPLPPSQNRLPVAIEGGEKYIAHH